MWTCVKTSGYQLEQSDKSFKAMCMLLSGGVLKDKHGREMLTEVNGNVVELLEHHFELTYVHSA